MLRRASPRERLLHVARVLGLALVYVLLGRIGPALIPMHGYASLVWPNSGVALAALILGGADLWPGVLIGALVNELGLGAPPLVAVAIAAGCTLEAVVATHVLHRIPGFHPSLGRLTDVLALMVLAGIACSMIGATVGTLSLVLGHDAPVPRLRTWLTWWTGDLMGILVVTPLVLTWARGPRPSTRPGDLAEAAAVGAVLVGASAFLFAQPVTNPWIQLFRPHVLFLPLLWATLRFGVRGAATAVFVIAVASVVAIYTGLGVHTRAALLENLDELQVFLFTAAFAKLTLGAIISERAAALESLRESDERQRLAIDAGQLGTWCWEIHTGRLVWSLRCRLLHGQDPSSPLIYEDFLATLHPDDRPRMLGQTEGAIAERGDYQTEYRVVWPDGSVHWISALGKVVLNESGNADRMLGVVLDITAQKEAEQTRADLLAREQAARRDAQIATKAKDDFLAVLSHELRTPLQSILGWTQMLRERPDDTPMVQKGLAAIDRSGKVQAHLIEDLLDVSRIVAGKLRMERVRVDVASVVATAVEAASAAAEAKSIPIAVTTEGMVGDVLGDPGRLLQVVSNLLSNAVKFTPRAGRIRVRVERRGTTARILIDDSGPGMSAEFLPHAFDRFHQQESTTRRAHGGLGLGLAIARHLVELHGGTVTAESPGALGGATFTVTLPLLSVARSAITLDRRKIKGGGVMSPVALEGVRVLVVDDDPDARELLETALHAFGAEVHAVPSVRAALAELDSFHPDLLLSDIGMPEEDGYALIRKLRARESTSGGHVPAVALTAFASQSDREQALELGFEEHLAKPTSPSELSRTMARLLGRAL